MTDRTVVSGLDLLPRSHSSSASSAAVSRALGGWLPCFRTGPLPCFRTGRAHSTDFHSRYPGRLGCRVSRASGYVYCPCSGSASRQRHLVLLDLGSRKSQISCRIAIISVPIATCSGSSALPTRLDRPSEFHGHRALFTDLAPARRGVISVFHVACSAGPCGPASPAAAARDFNTEFSPATFRVS